MIGLAFLFILVFGNILLMSIDRYQSRWNPALFCLVGFGLGASCISFLTFFTFYIQHSFQPKLILQITYTFAFLLLMHNILYCRTQWIQFFQKIWEHINAVLLVFFPLFVFGYAGLILIQQHPFGQWDAWAVWNMKYRFLVLAHDWTIIFQELHPYTQRDYPLMLPMLNTWMTAFAGKHLNIIPQWTAFTFYLITPVLLMSGLMQFFRRNRAILIGLLLFLVPSYGTLATSQYADVLLSFYLMSAFILILNFVRNPSRSKSILVGLMLGTLSCIKNEGLVLMLLLGACTFISFMIKSKEKTWQRSAFFVSSLLIASLPAWIIKIKLAPLNQDIFHSISLMQTRFFNIDGFFHVLTFLLNEMFQTHWAYVWFFLCILGLIGFRKLFFQENRIFTIFFISYAIVLMGIYLTTTGFDLNWRLENTLSRILFYLLPSTMFSAMYLLFSPEKTHE